jgi:hypothetical protein
VVIPKKPSQAGGVGKEGSSVISDFISAFVLPITHLLALKIGT